MPRITHLTVHLMNSPAPARLTFFPVSFFATIMGMSGFTIAWNKAEHIFDPGFCISSGLHSLTPLLFVALTLIYATKMVKHPAAVMGELRHPVKLAFVPTFSIGLLLLATACLHVAPELSFWLWAVGAGVHLALTLYVLSSWMHHTQYEIVHLNPAWFIPVVGNIIVPIAGIHHASPEISWFFFSLGIFFWPILTAILFYRLIFHASLPDRLIPTLFIFIAPPAVGFISWYNLVGGIDAFGRVLYFVGLVFTLLLATQIRYFVRLKFFMSWWAYSFPMAAITIATLIMAKETGLAFYTGLAAVLLGILTLIITGLLIRTGMAVVRHEICVEGH